LDLNGVVSCFPTFKRTQEEFDTCDRYGLTYESPEYDTSAKSFNEQEAGMMDSRGRLKVSGDSHPRWRHLCTLCQKELEVKTPSVSYSDTSAKFQDLSIVLDKNVNILLTDLEHNIKNVK
jgi:hypothetical protein